MIDDADAEAAARETRANPVLLTLMRGDFVESFHRGAVAIWQAGRPVVSVGDTTSPVYLRSAAKPFQLAAALAAGLDRPAALDARALAVMAASHNGEPEHVAIVRQLLAHGGFDEADLRCGSHPSLRLEVGEAMARRGEVRGQLHHNCSGKHAGMLLFTRHLGADPARYLEPDHPVQTAIRALLQRVAGSAEPYPTLATDGCSAPTPRLPLQDLAAAFGRLADPGHAATDDQSALRRVRDAMLAEPFLVAGTGRIDTDLMLAANRRVVSKIGAEGVMACGIVDRGIGIAIKIDDGAARGYEPVALAVLDRLGALDDHARRGLARYLDPVQRNHVGRDIGRRVVTLPS